VLEIPSNPDQFEKSVTDIILEEQSLLRFKSFYFSIIKTCLGKPSEKKYGIIWEFFPNGGPPPFWEPLVQKKIMVYFAF